MISTVGTVVQILSFNTNSFRFQVLRLSHDRRDHFLDEPRNSGLSSLLGRNPSRIVSTKMRLKKWVSLVAVLCSSDMQLTTEHKLLKRWIAQQPSIYIHVPLIKELDMPKRCLRSNRAFPLFRLFQVFLVLGTSDVLLTTELDVLKLVSLIVLCSVEMQLTTVHTLLERWLPINQVCTDVPITELDMPKRCLRSNRAFPLFRLFQVFLVLGTSDVLLTTELDVLQGADQPVGVVYYTVHLACAYYRWCSCLRQARQHYWVGRWFQKYYVQTLPSDS
jgi:hypothetical protein